MAFRKGAKAAEEAEKNKPKGGGSFRKTEYFGIKEPDTSEVVRFLTDHDAWLLVKEHTFIPTRDPQGHGLPENTVKNWNPNGNATCRYDEAFKNEDGSKEYPDCYICDHMVTDKNRPQKPKERIYSLVCLRDEVIATQEDIDEGVYDKKKLGKVVGYTDRFREVQDTDEEGKPIEGQTKEILDIQVACFAWSNFYQALQVLAESYDETVLDRDIKITRKGTGFDTKYSVTPMPEQYFFGFDPDNPEDEKRVLDVRDEDVAAYYAEDGLPDLEAIVTQRSTDFHYERFFDVRSPIPMHDWEKEQAAKEGNGGSERKSTARPSNRRGPVARGGGAKAEPQAAEETQGGEDEGGEEESATVDVERRQRIGQRLRESGRRETTDA